MYYTAIIVKLCKTGKIKNATFWLNASFIRKSDCEDLTMRIIAYMWLSVAGHKFIVTKHQPNRNGTRRWQSCLHFWCVLIEMNRLVRLSTFLSRIWDVFFECRVLKQDIILELESWMWTHSTKKLQQACVSENDCSYKSFALSLSLSLSPPPLALMTSGMSSTPCSFPWGEGFTIETWHRFCVP